MWTQRCAPQANKQNHKTHSSWPFGIATHADACETTPNAHAFRWFVCLFVCGATALVHSLLRHMGQVYKLFPIASLDTQRILDFLTSVRHRRTRTHDSAHLRHSTRVLAAVRDSSQIKPLRCARWARTPP
jgi:hypothetical protein